MRRAAPVTALAIAVTLTLVAVLAPPDEAALTPERPPSVAVPAATVPVSVVAPTETPSPTPLPTRARTPSPKPTPAATPTKTPRPRHYLAGLATWYNDGPGYYAAAGPALRRAIGPGWRDRIVTVCVRRCITGVRLSDWCACGKRNGRNTVLDLSLFTFARLGPPGRGVMEVTVSWK